MLLTRIPNSRNAFNPQDYPTLSVEELEAILRERVRKENPVLDRRLIVEALAEEAKWKPWPPPTPKPEPPPVPTYPAQLTSDEDKDDRRSLPWWQQGSIYDGDQGTPDTPIPGRST